MRAIDLAACPAATDDPPWRDIVLAIDADACKKKGPLSAARSTMTARDARIFFMIFLFCLPALFEPVNTRRFVLTVHHAFHRARPVGPHEGNGSCRLNGGQR